MIFSIHITNTGDTWITTLPLRDVYSPTYLAYGDCGVEQTAAPWPDDYADDGQLDWSDLTAAAPYGFGTDLPPGADFTIIVTFTAAADTSMLPGGATVNSATVHDALADPDGSGGPLPEEPLPDETYAATIQIITPTCRAPFADATRLADAGSPALQPTCRSTIGGQVWYDVDFDGYIGAGEPGIDNVLVFTYWDDGDDIFEPGAGDPFFEWAVTGPDSYIGSDHGLYNFALPPPVICGEDEDHSGLWVDIDGSNFAPGGSLFEMVLTSGETYFPPPAFVFLPDWFGYMDDVSFGFNVPGSYTLAALGQPVSQRVGQPISVSFRITNTGPGWLTSLPLTSLYDPTYLTYEAAAPPSEDVLNDGEITWDDLAGGSAAPLPPGDGVTIVITFTGVTDTSYLPGGTTTVTASSAGAFADPDGPSNYLPAMGPLRTRWAAEEVEVLRPTGLTLSQLGAEAVEEGVLLTWQTESEGDILGFNVLRREQNDGELEVVNPELIVAEHAGADRGARYAYLDGRVKPGVYGWYVLEVILLDGRTERRPLPFVNAGEWR